MPGPTKDHLETARRLLEQKGGGSSNPNQRAEAAGSVYETLFRSLAPVIGAAGVRALFARSVKLTKTEFPCLGEVVVVVDSSEGNIELVQQLHGCLSKLEPHAVLQVTTGLYANLLSLLANFIGEQLAWQITKGAFPAIDRIGTKEKSDE